jgi:hypothetical protein
MSTPQELIQRFLQNIAVQDRTPGSSLEQARGLVNMENAANQQRMAEFGGGPVGQQNKAAKNSMIEAEGRANPVQMTRTGMVKAYEPIRAGRNIIEQQVTNPTKYRMPRASLAGPVGKLPIVGALPMPSVIAGALADDEQKQLGWREKMMRFLGRSVGADIENPDMI